MLEKFTFDIQAPRIKKKKLILVKSQEEKREHVVMKMLAYMIFYDPRLQIEVSVDMHYKPDLVIMGDHSVPELWIDCGKTALKKLDNLSRKLKKTRIIIVKEDKGELERFRKITDKKIEHADKIEYLSFEPGFVAGIAASLEKVNEVTLYDVVEGVIGLALNENVFESQTYS